MQFKKLLSDDDAVSPVIGVILMVAITVILAAVIASFVLGLGGDSDVQPNTALDFDYSPVDEELEITISSGDSLDPNQVYIRGVIGDDDTTYDVNEDLANILEHSNIDNGDGDPAGITDDHVLLNTTGGLAFEDTSHDGGGVEEEISSGQGIVLTINSQGSVTSLDESDFDIVWDTGDDSATLDGFEGPEA